MIESGIDADGIAVVRLASPETANALSAAAYAELTECIVALQRKDSGAKALVLTGSGKVFSAGANLDVLNATDANALAAAITGAVLPLHRALAGGRLPTIAAVNGAAIGGAVGLALAFDIVVAARSARFSLVFAKLGLVPDTGLTRVLPDLIGEARARALMMTAADITAESAAACGMIHRVVDDDALMDDTMALARQLAALPEGSHRLIREAIASGRDRDIESQIAYEAALQAERVLSPEFKAAMAAFAARGRRPRTPQ